MRMVAWPTRWNEEEGWLPVDAQEVELRATPQELRELASFLIATAKQLEDSANVADELRAGLEFADSDGGEMPIVVEIVREPVGAESDGPRQS